MLFFNVKLLNSVINKYFFLETTDTFLLLQAAKFYLDAQKKLFDKLKQLEKINGRIAMGGLVYLLFTKLVSSHTDILNQLKSILV